MHRIPFFLLVSLWMAMACVSRRSEGPQLAGEVIGNYPLVEGLCSQGDFCRENPTPSSETLRAVFGVASDDAWFAGDNGTLLHLQGSIWSQVVLDPPVTLFDAWGAFADDVWFCGDRGTVLHWDGSVVQQVAVGTPSGALRAITGRFQDDVWIGGDTRLLHWNGATWSEMPMPPHAIGKLAALPGQDLWAVPAGAAGGGALISRWNGSDWTTYGPLDEDEGFQDVWLSEGGKVVVTGILGMAFQWDQQAWGIVDGGTVRGSTVTGSASNDITLVYDDVATHFDGTNWLPETLPQRVSSPTITASGGSTRWLVGADGVILRSVSGGAWESVGSGLRRNIAVIVGTGPMDVWAVGAGALLHREQNGWTAYTTGVEEVYDAVSVSSGTGWAVGYSGSSGSVLHWAADTISLVPALTQAQVQSGVVLRGVVAFTAGDVWSVGNHSTVLHWDGHSWSTREFPFTDDLFRVAKVGTDVWAFGMNAAYRYRRDASLWEKVPNAAGPVVSVCAVPGAETMWAVSASPESAALEWNGASWTRLPPNPISEGPTVAVWCGAGGSVYFANSRSDIFSSGQVFRYSGGSWALIPMAGRLPQALWEDGAGGLWVGGSSGDIRVRR